MAIFKSSMYFGSKNSSDVDSSDVVFKEFLY